MASPSPRGGERRSAGFGFGGRGRWVCQMKVSCSVQTGESVRLTPLQWPPSLVGLSRWRAPGAGARTAARYRIKYPLTWIPHFMITPPLSNNIRLLSCPSMTKIKTREQPHTWDRVPLQYVKWESPCTTLTKHPMLPARGVKTIPLKSIQHHRHNNTNAYCWHIDRPRTCRKTTRYWIKLLEKFRYFPVQVSN